MSMNWAEIGEHVDHPHGVELIYEKALEYSKKLPENKIFMEIGTHKGGTAMAIMQAIKDSGKDRWLFTVDPYGSKPFKLGMDIQQDVDYGDDLYREAMYQMSNYARKLGVKHYHWRMTSDDFMLSFPGIAFWEDGKLLKPDFGFVYIDGDHNCYTVEREMLWLLRHMDEGMLVMDDIPWVDMNDRPIIKKALANGFQDNFRCYWDIKDESQAS